MLSNWISDSDIQSNYGEPVYTNYACVQQLISKWKNELITNANLRWNILLKENQISIGQIGICHRDIEHNNIDIEYCIGKAYQGKGYAKEALKSVVNYIFLNTTVERIQAFHRGRNIASGKVLSGAGFNFEGVHKRSFKYKNTNEYDDKIWYGITREDYNF